MSTRARRKALAEALWPAARRRVLGLLLPHPEREWHLREIARRTGISPSAVQREVLSLVGAGILERRLESRRAYYRPNASCPIFPELRQISLKTVGLVDLLREALLGLPGVQVAFVYGSLARGEETARSDVDLLVVGDVTFAELSQRLYCAQQMLAREVNPTLYPPAEFRDKIAQRHHFLLGVLEGPKLFVIGGADVLGRLAGPGLADQAKHEAG